MMGILLRDIHGDASVHFSCRPNARRCRCTSGELIFRGEKSAHFRRIVQDFEPALASAPTKAALQHKEDVGMADQEPAQDVDDTVNHKNAASIIFSALCYDD